MSTYLKILTIILLSVSLYSQTLEPKNSVENFGIEISNTTVSPIEELLNNPSDHLGNNVTIKGEILDVCPMMGCWYAIVAACKKESGSVCREASQD